MPRIDFEENEEISRKEYLKRKRKQKREFKKKSKTLALMMIIIAVLIIYVVIQIIVYKRQNNYSYLSDESVDKQTVYNVYYITEGYTYSPKYSLSSIYSNGNSDKLLLSDVGMSQIRITPSLIVGVKDNKIYKFDKITNDLTLIVDEEIDKFTIYQNEIYLICKNKELKKYNLDNGELNNLNIKEVSEVLVDKDNLYVVRDEKIRKRLFKYDKSGGNETKLTNNENVSYIIQDDLTLYFVNKEDGNKIYKVNKDGSNLMKISDISSITDKGVLKEIDGSKYMYIHNGNLYYVNSDDSSSLWKYSFSSGTNEKEISMPVEILQNVDDTVFFKVKNDIGVYLYNTDTGFMSEITKRKVKEFLVDTYTKVFLK